MTASPATLIVDLDGTLIDSNYQHALAWWRALTADGIDVPVWRVHRAIGMGGDQLVTALAGAACEAERGEHLRGQWRRQFDPFVEEIRPFDHATTLLASACSLGMEVVLASSSPPELVEHYLDLLGARSLVSAWTTAEDVARTKPAPDLLQVALHKVSTTVGCAVGDSVWDVHAARATGIPCVCVRTGGFGVDELRQAGAAAVYDDLQQLSADLSRWRP